MDFAPGQIVYQEFVTSASTGAATNADSLPAATLNRNGTDTVVSVTVTNIDTGRYKAVYTIPTTYVPGDVLILSVAATISSVTGKAAFPPIKLGTALVGQGTATAGGNASVTLQTALGADIRGVGCLIVITAGTGAGQAAVITGYVNSTQVATVSKNWVTNPDSTSVYAIVPAALAKVDSALGATLASTGLDAVSATQPAGPASTFREMLVWLWMRFNNKSLLDTNANTLIVTASDSTTTVTTQSATNSGGVQTLGKTG